MEALEIIRKLRVVDFDWKETGQHDIGLIAEEVEKVIPEAVYRKNGQIEGIRLMPIMAVMIEAIKELEIKNGTDKTEPDN